MEQMCKSGTEGNTPLHEAIVLNNEEEVFKLLELPDTDCNKSNCLGETPFQYAAFYGNISIIDYIIIFNVCN